jgi:transcription initiation factor IIE alpha subunit
MLDNFIREAVVLVVGKSYESLSVLLNKNSYVNEFIIAKKLEITINQARNLLYRLSESGLVSSIRKKDKKKGWYTYFWKIEPLKTLEFFKSTLSKKRELILK